MTTSVLGSAVDRISVIVTVLNEEASIEKLLTGLSQQTYPPMEVIVVDGGSTDQTVQLIKSWQQKHHSFPLRWRQRPGNRSRGRNAAAALATGDWLAITDAGCVPQPSWLKELITTAHRTQTRVVAGYYQADPVTSFQAAVVPYVLVMPDQLSLAQFLPATRSMLIERRLWQRIGGLDEKLEISEDYELARRLQRAGIEMSLAAAAKVIWQPPSTLPAFIRMVSQMAEYDLRGGVTRIKAWLVLARYLLVASLLVWLVLTGNLATGKLLVLIGVGIYGGWAIWKNYQYTPDGWYWLPILQVSADWGVIVGLMRGILARYLNQQ